MSKNRPIIKSSRHLSRGFAGVMAWLLIFGVGTSQIDTRASAAAGTTGACRFGIASLGSVQGYPLETLNVGADLNWGQTRDPALPDNIEYIHVLRLGDRGGAYLNTLNNLATWVTSYPGSVWIIGNEPDTTYEDQDNLIAEDYAYRYYQVATIIRSLDPSAKLGFGTIVQPTPIRMRYLDKVWNRLVDYAGSPYEVQDLIDIWSIHSFVLNEYIGNDIYKSWGTGVPPGFENDHADAIEISYADTHSNIIFEQRIRNFRQWMMDKGQQSKPLWITEYGSLFPSTILWLGVTDADTIDFMLKSFDFLRTAEDPRLGLATDRNRLVQRWIWFSLNGDINSKGGSLYDPTKSTTIPTKVGSAFINYTKPGSSTIGVVAEPDYTPESVVAVPLGNAEGGKARYRLRIRVRDTLSPDNEASFRLMIYDRDPNSGGQLLAGPVYQCGGPGYTEIPWPDEQLGSQKTLYVEVEPTGTTDPNLTNNIASFAIFFPEPKLAYLPTVFK